MLQLTRRQIAHFEANAEAGFAKRLARYIRRHHGNEEVRLPTSSFFIAGVPLPALIYLVERTIARGHSHGLDTESSLAAFAVLMVVVAPNFDLHPAIQPALSDHSLPADARIDKLWVDTTTQAWTDMRRAYDPAAWLVY